MRKVFITVSAVALSYSRECIIYYAYKLYNYTFFFVLMSPDLIEDIENGKNDPKILHNC